MLLNYLVFGAHFVFVLDPTEVGSETISPDFFDYMYDDSGVSNNLQNKVFDSHYSFKGQNSGMSYPSTVIVQDTVPNPAPLMCAALIGPTVQPMYGTSAYNSGQQRDDFFQLEGWRQFGTSTSGWHNADYDSYNETLWNFSTYGACAFSEKRATALFLAPAGWEAVPTAGTFMPPYLGAQTPQSWLQTDLISLS